MPQDLFSGTTDNCPSSLILSIEGSTAAYTFSCADTLAPRTVVGSVTDGFSTEMVSVNVTVLDTNNRCTSCTPDVKPPTLSCPASAVIPDFRGSYEFGASDAASFGIVASDACSSVQFSFSPPTFTCADLAGVSVQVSVTDQSRLSSSCVVVVTAQQIDSDSDGYDRSSCGLEADCNDDNDSIYPGLSWFVDEDKDGWGQTSSETISCAPPSLTEQWVRQGGDCDDANSAIFPGQTWFLDADGDGFGSQIAHTFCPRPVNGVLENGDCNDSDRDISPGLLEVCGNDIDDNCDGVSGVDRIIVLSNSRRL